MGAEPQQPAAAGPHTLAQAANPNAFRVTGRTVMAIAIPMTFAYLAVPLVGLVDTAVIGQLGVPALIGGIAVGALLFDILFTTFNFLRGGTTGLTAQALGAGDRPEIIAVLARGLILAALCGLAVVALQRPFIEFGLWAMDLEPAISGPARIYLSIRIWATPFALAGFVLTGWLLGLARAGIVMLLQLAAALVNVGLSLLLVIGYGWGVVGVATASVAAEFVLFALSLVAVWFALPGRAGGRVWPGWARIAHKPAFARIIAVNRDIMIRSFILLFVFAFFAREGARLGEIVLAANAILMQLVILCAYFLDGLATASEQLAGRAVGARYRPAFARAVRLSLAWGVGTAMALSLIYLVIGKWLIAVMTTSVEVRELAADYLLWASLAPLAGAVAYIMDGVYIGATWSREMRNMMLLSALGFLLVWAVAVPVIGNHGLWLAVYVFLGARGITLYMQLPRRSAETFAA